MPLILRRELTRKAGTLGSRKKWLDGQKKWRQVKRSVIKNPEYFSTYMQEELKALV
ncbi:protein [Escherichia coli]|uniref:Protein n=1 Tax=Escherichia coli TaxID=562 RepID=A0A2X1N9U9_ECOLX|nr:protein [Escherichia coli]